MNSIVQMSEVVSTAMIVLNPYIYDLGLKSERKMLQFNRSFALSAQSFTHIMLHNGKPDDMLNQAKERSKREMTVTMSHH